MRKLVLDNSISTAQQRAMSNGNDRHSRLRLPMAALKKTRLAARGPAHTPVDPSPLRRTDVTIAVAPTPHHLMQVEVGVRPYYLGCMGRIVAR
jgi:hypothetical protein